MKYRYISLLIVPVLLAALSGHAQLIGGSAYLQGHWLEIGMLANGSFGAPAPPATYHPFPAGSNLAETYDINHDGWTVGTPPYMGDYTYPGSPFEGWSLEIGAVRNQAFAPGVGYTGTGTLTGGLTTYTNTGGTIIGNWAGTASSGGLTINQETRIDTEASAVVVTTVFHNISGASISDIYYMRSCDPDNDEAHGGPFSTDNMVVFQNDAYHRVAVNAHGTTFNDDFTLATKDCRALAVIYDSWPISSSVSLASIYDGTLTAGYHSDLNVLHTGDIAIMLLYKIGTIPAGDSAVISYAYVFNGLAGIDSAFPEPALVVDGTVVPPTLPLPATINDTFNVCEHPGLVTIPVNVINASDKCWTWSKWTWSPSTGLAATTGVNNTITLTALSGPTTYTITGTDSATGMESCNYRVMYLTVLPCFSATSNSPGPPGVTICMNETLVLQAHGDSLGATYLWYGPAGFTATTQYTSRGSLNILDTGVYTVVRTIGSGHDTARTRVFLNDLPHVTATSNGPICSGTPNTLMLTATVDSPLVTFVWSGPLSFNSILQNPSIPDPPVSASGIYKVVTTLHGCHDSGIINVVVDSTPAIPTVSSNTPQCSGHRDTVKLAALSATLGTQYSWAGPLSFTSSLQNPNIPNPHVPTSGTYTVTASIAYDGITCRSRNTTDVLVDSTPYLPSMASNGPICSGSTLLLTATSTDLSAYNWTGPNGFTSATQNPSIPAATTLATAVYTVSATIIYPGIPGGCTSDSGVLSVVVDSLPEVPSVTSNSPGPPIICQGDTLRLFSSDNTAGVSFSWVGPSSFVSVDQNPTIYPVNPAATGVYTVTATLGMCSSAAVTTVTITPTPILAATNNGPICTGVKDTLFLQAVSDPGATFSWSGPYTFVSTQQNPYRTPVNIEFSGIYQVRALLNGCPSLPVNDTVVIRQTPPAPWVSWLTFCQSYDAPPLQAFGDSILWYPSSAAGAIGTLTAPVPPTVRDTVMWFFTTQTRMSCMSALDSFKVTVNPKPTVAVSPSGGVCPHDSVVLTAVDADPIDYYHWSPGRYLNDTSGPTVISRPETDVTYRVVATNKYGCTDTAEVTVTVKPGAVLNLNTSPTVTLLPGESIQLSPLTNCTSFTWFPPAGLDNAYISNPVAAPEVSTRYWVEGVTDWGCKTKDSVDIEISSESQLAIPNAFIPGSGPNGSFKIILRGLAKLRYFRIYDRWGIKVFETTDITKGWDGNFNGKEQPVGVYIYEAGAVTSTGRDFVKQGNLTLLR